jgi:hypothetical protein
LLYSPLSYSPPRTPGLGGHFNFEPPAILANAYLDTLFTTLSRTFPTPLNIFAGPHKPGANQPVEWQPAQGPHKVRIYKEEMPGLLEERSREKEAYRGAARYLDFYPMSDGAISYDGVHYPYQVNMEKAQIILVRPVFASFSFLSLH